MAARVPCNLITGALGVGKTTAILELLKRRPGEERWAVLVNEFGEVGIDAAVIGASGDEGVAVREVQGGCICCTANLPLRVALTELLRRAKPHRLLIEPTGLGHPAGIIDTLRDEWLIKALELRAVVCLVDPREFSSERIEASPVYRDQLDLADVLLANKADLASEHELRHFLDYARAMYPPKLQVGAVEHARLEPDWLDLTLDARRFAAAPTDAVAACELTVSGARSAHHVETSDQRGWTFSAQTLFDRTRLRALLEGLDPEAFQRAKGVMHTGREWELFNWARGELDVNVIAYRRDSRVEFIAHEGSRVDWDALEAALVAAIKA